MNAIAFDTCIHDLSVDDLDLVAGGLDGWGIIRGVGMVAGGVVMIGTGVGIAGGSGGLATVGGAVVASFGGVAVYSGVMMVADSL